MSLIPQPVSAREVAFNVLYKVEKQKAYANVLLEAAFDKTSLSPRDRALVTELVYGVLRNRSWLDGVIKQYSRRRWSQISLGIKNILRLGAYQLLMLDRISAYAAVNEAVESAHRSGESAAAGFINAILRRISREPPDLSLPHKPAVDYLAQAYSHPRWLVNRWLNRWGEAETEALCTANNQRVPLSVRVNTLRVSLEEARKALAAQGLTLRPDSRMPEALYIEKGGGITSLASYQQGWLEIEGLASMLVVHVLSPQPGENILDACAGRGVKTTHIAQLMRNCGRILALDNKPRKLRQLRENCQRLGVNIVWAVAQDISHPLGFERIGFDRILLDAPCSSLGVIGRYPECRWQRSSSDIPRLAKEQERMLRQVATHSVGSWLKPGGVLVYSTCSFEPEENEGMIQPFLQANKEFELDDPSPYLPPELQAHVQGDGYLRLLPHRWGGDGFFVARLRKHG